MPTFFQFRASFLLLLNGVAIAMTSCSGGEITSSAVQPTSPIASPVAAPSANSTTKPVPPVTSPTAAATSDSYQRAIARASSAYTISQSAQSQDDWRLVASRWQQAIDLMAAVPNASANHRIAQQKLPEYRRNLTYAQQQASRPTVSNNPGRVVLPPPQVNAGIPGGIAPAAPTGAVAGSVFRVPIARRMGGTPVVNVTFNGSQTYEMIVDTGASGTLITQAMATSLGVTPVGQVRVDTASARDVAFPLGYVNTIEVGGAIANDVVVAVAGPDLSVGLLGHDFFGNYDVTIRQNEVEFRAR
jgi:predicted aspartyl protease